MPTGSDKVRSLEQYVAVRIGEKWYVRKSPRHPHIVMEDEQTAKWLAKRLTAHIGALHATSILERLLSQHLGTSVASIRSQVRQRMLEENAQDGAIRGPSGRLP